eukprot:297708-Pleurochrysis_carterae.AAC.1
MPSSFSTALFSFRCSVQEVLGKVYSTKAEVENKRRCVPYNPPSLDLGAWCSSCPSASCSLHSFSFLLARSLLSLFPGLPVP